MRYGGYGAAVEMPDTITVDWPGIENEMLADAIAANLIQVSAQLGSKVVGSVEITKEDQAWRVRAALTPFYFAQPKQIVTAWGDPMIHDDILDGFMESTVTLLNRNQALQAGLVSGTYEIDMESVVVETGAGGTQRARFMVYPPTLTEQGAAVYGPVVAAAEKKPFPWGWVALGLGGAVIGGIVVYGVTR